MGGGGRQGEGQRGGILVGGIVFPYPVRARLAEPRSL